MLWLGWGHKEKFGCNGPVRKRKKKNDESTLGNLEMNGSI